MRGARLAFACSVLWAFPHLAHAEAPDAIQHCETVTTVRCTPAAAQPAAPSAAAAPAPVPVCPPPEPPEPSLACCAEPRQQLLPPTSLPGGWQLRYDEQQRPVYERSRRGTTPGLWAPGLILWMGTFLGGTVAAIRDDRPWAFAPFFGPLGSGVVEAFDGNPGRAAGYAFLGLTQIAGFIMFVTGASTGSPKIERLPVRVAPLAFRDGGGGLSVGASF